MVGPENSFFMSVLNTHGEKPDTYINSQQVFDNIEVTNHSTIVYQAWFQQTFWHDKSSILVGLYDLNSEFYVTNSLMFLFTLLLELGQILV